MSRQEKHILIVCGEPSGDLNAAKLVKEIHKIEPQIRFSGVGGNLLREAGCTIYSDIKELSVIGFFDVLKKLPKFFALKKLILDKICSEKFDLIILVDFSGFNLRLSKAIGKKIPVIYYTSPQVWASRSGRIKTIKKYINKMIVFFRFEEDLYKRSGVDVTCVGHPLLDIVTSQAVRKDFFDRFKLYDSKTTVALLPGSRQQEVKHILPVMLKAAEIILENNQQVQFILAKPSQVDWDVYHHITHAFKIDLKVAEGIPYDCLKMADFALVASGTATLETTILEKPFFIIYKMGLLNYLLYRPQIKVPYIGMVNIVAQKQLIPEFIQFRARPRRIAEEFLKLVNDQERLRQMQNELSQVKRLLGEKEASRRAAQCVVDFLNQS